MFSHYQIVAQIRRFRYSCVFFVAMLLLISCASVLAQGVGTGRDLSDSGGNHIIGGRIYFPAKPPDGIRIKVRLESNSAPSLTTSSDADGVFRFSGVNTGSYIVVVDAGEQYEVFREQINIEGGNTYSPRTVQIPIYLRLKGGVSGPRPGVTSAALAGVPKSAVEFYEKGRESAQKGDGKKAVEQFTKALETHPQFGLALNELGVQYLKLGQPDKAAEALQSAVKIMPDEAPPHLNYGIALLNLKKFPEAEEQLRIALQKNDKVPTAHMYLGITLLNLSRDEKTKQFDQAKYTEAQKEFESAITTGKEEVAQAHRYLGGIYWGNRDYKRAADEFEVYLKLAPKAPDAEKIRAAIKELRSKQ